MHQFLQVVSEREHMSMNDVVREALRLHLDEQEGIIGSRSRFASRVARQLETDRQHLTHCVTLILAAQLVPLINQGARGSQIIEQIRRIVAQSDGQIRQLIADRKITEGEQSGE